MSDSVESGAKAPEVADDPKPSVEETPVEETPADATPVNTMSGASTETPGSQPSEETASVESAAPNADALAKSSGERRVAQVEAVTTVPIRIEKSNEAFARLHAVVEYAVPGSVRYPDFTSDSILHNDRPVVIGVTSAVAGEGKSTVAMHMASTIARNNYKKVCLIDLSLGEDKLSRALPDGASQGLIQVLEGDSYVIQTYQSQEIDGLQIMPSGRVPTNAARAARSPAVSEILGACRELYDVVVVDLPSVSSGNVMPIASHLDGIVLVVCAGVTPKDVVASAVTHLDRKRVMGVVLNRVRTSVPRWIQKRFAPWW